MKKRVYVISCGYGLLGVVTNIKKVYEGITASAVRNDEELFLEEVVESEARHIEIKKLKFTYNNLNRILRNSGYATVCIEGIEAASHYKVDMSYLNGTI